jgi:hypothetical protein
VRALGVFSDPPDLADLADLTLDERDLEAIRECVPGDCALKLSAPEIESLSLAVADAGTEWRHVLQVEFRRVLVARVNRYRTAGLAGLPPNAYRRPPMRLDDTFAGVMAASPYLTRLPGVAAWLQGYPDADDRGAESFFYWWKEDYGAGKPVIGVTHVGIFPAQPGAPSVEVIVTGKQILATRYVNGSLGLTMVLRHPEHDSRYLVYLNRSQVDLLKGLLSPLRRMVLERRVTRDTPEVVRALRERLESGAPPEAM